MQAQQLSWFSNKFILTCYSMAEKNIFLGTKKGRHQLVKKAYQNKMRFARAKARTNTKFVMKVG